MYAGLQVGTVPFEELVAVKQDGTTSKGALKPLSKRASDGNKVGDYKRDNKNRPMEMSSKRPVPRLREVVQVTKRWALEVSPVVLMAVTVSVHSRVDLSVSPRVCDPACSSSRDPRFDDLSGNLSADRFRKQYAFLYDEQLPAERDQLKATLQVHV